MGKPHGMISHVSQQMYTHIHKHSSTTPYTNTHTEREREEKEKKERKKKKKRKGELGKFNFLAIRSSSSDFKRGIYLKAHEFMYLYSLGF